MGKDDKEKLSIYLHEYDDPGWGVVVLAGAVDEAHCVQHRGEQGPKVMELCSFHGLSSF